MGNKPGLKRVALRMDEALQKQTKRYAKREKISFGRFVREAVRERIAAKSKWIRTGPGWMDLPKEEYDER